MSTNNLGDLVGKRYLLNHRDGTLSIAEVARDDGFANSNWPYRVGEATYTSGGYAWSRHNPLDHDIIRAYDLERVVFHHKEPDFILNPDADDPRTLKAHLTPALKDAAQRALEALTEFLALEDEDEDRDTNVDDL